MKALNYIVGDDYFKRNDYTYQELFASDVPYFHKKVDEWKIWCRKSDKTLFINDWYDELTPTILQYFTDHRYGEDVQYSKTFDYHFLSLRLNRKTGEICNFTYDMLDTDLYHSTTQLVLPIEGMNEVLTEIQNLTGMYL